MLKVSNAALRYHPASQTSPPASAAKSGSKGAAPEKAVWILDAGQQAAAGRASLRAKAMAQTRRLPAGGLKDGDRVIVAALAKAAPASGGSPVSQTGAKGQRAGILSERHIGHRSSRSRIW